METKYIILSLNKEYPGYAGTEKWMIITDLSENEFAALYPSKYGIWKDAVIVSTKVGKAIFRYKYNEQKHLKRDTESLEASNDTSVLRDYRHTDPILKLTIQNSIDMLPGLQGSRIRKHYLEGLAVKELAEMEGVSVRSIQSCMQRGLLNLKRYFDLPLTSKEEKNDK